MLVILLMTRALKLPAFLACIALAAACDGRIDGLTGTTGNPPINEFGNMGMVAVNDTVLPRSTTNSGVVYSMLSGTFSLKSDSTWLASTVERVSSNGVIDTTASNYSGTWRATGSLLTLPGFGTARIKGDTIFWFKGPRHSWEDSIKYTFVKK